MTKENFNITPHNKQSDFFMQLFMNGGDGLILIFFTATLLFSVDVNQTTLTSISAAIIFLAGIIMGLSGYIASLIEKGHFRQVLEKEVYSEEIRKETLLLDNLQIHKDLQKQALEEMEKDRKHWESLMEGIDISRHRTPGYTVSNGVNTGTAYLIGGILPLLPYLLTDKHAFTYSVILSALGLIIFGYFKSFYNQTPYPISIIKSLAAGLMAGVGAYAAGKIFAIFS